MRRATVVVIGAGQAGLSAAYHLTRSGFSSALSDPHGDRTFVVLDAEIAAGGAWRHRWPSLTIRTVNGIFDLPGLPKPPMGDDEPSREAVPRYLADFERAMTLPILRPVTVSAVARVNAAADGELRVESDGGTWHTRFLVNATGTWTSPVLPDYRGRESFRGLQLHTRDYRRADDFAGQRVAVVGGGISAVQQLEEISRHATTFWYTRREPVFLEGDFRAETGRDVVARVAADVAAGRPTGSVVSYTGLVWTPEAIAARDRGALRRRPMFARIEPGGVREADGTLTPVDSILWATGFTPALTHLDPLHLRGGLGGIAMRGTQVADEPRVHLVGYGPSQSTVGANRAGRSAVAAIGTTLARRASRASGSPLPA
ncbi:NAD(P)-binding domain-containing protein [Pengzhenrongella sicca]|uniref:NAD(P)/FAD-dependent oxidoreductase n=1 Tax=Pengzhenrongella sicca TaxID=2819238 RepID=A0A8A4ZCC4_9MICO|nr:NAD(P)-binding domain-containing protein [Pengzhenrongella sicca]QTE28147.1 NAD(P)/FAD-dependent oxidoreductase [Pengzhenrongella sicca]